MSSPNQTELPKAVEQLPLDQNGSVIEDSKYPEPSHIKEGDYAVLMETNGKESESWYYFIRCENNMEELRHLQDQLEKIDWYLLDDLPIFDIDMEHFVSAKTAKEMTKLELNSYAFHRKFDGKLQMIDFGFKKRELKYNNTEKLMAKVYDHLGYGQIEDYIDDEDIDQEDLASTSSETESSEEEASCSDSSDSDTDNYVLKKGRKIPPCLLNNNLPRFAAKAQYKKALKNKKSTKNHQND